MYLNRGGWSESKACFRWGDLNREMNKWEKEYLNSGKSIPGRGNSKDKRLRQE